MRLNWNCLSKYRSQIYALSILWIFLFHALGEDADADVFQRIPYYIINAGNLGVEVFLFLSGVSMYYARKKRTSVKQFYEERFAKIIKIYVCFCIPIFFLEFCLGMVDGRGLVREILFSVQNVNRFWFLLCIMICYLMYPWIYSLIQRKKEKWILLGLLFYVAVLVVFNEQNHDAFAYDEILITRIPIFVIGSLAGKCVYEKKEIRPIVLFLLLVGILGRDVLDYVYAQSPALNDNKIIISRLYGGVIAVGMIFLTVILVPYLKDTMLDRWLQYLGTITLEIYVVHVSCRPFLKRYFKIPTETGKECLLYTLILFVITMVGAVLLHKGMEKLKGKAAGT